MPYDNGNRPLAGVGLLVDAFVQRFEKAWQNGGRPAIDDFLPQDGPDRLAVLIELVKVDMERRRRAGAPAADYLNRYPELACANATQLHEFPQKDQVDASPTALPQQIGRYRVQNTLGQGGFGIVYKAHDDQLDRHVAVKVPHAQRISTAEDASAYLAEARAVAKLDHPNIVPVHDAGSTEQFPCFIVSKYIDGGTLAKMLKEGLPSFGETINLVAAIADALHYAHRHGLVHRDIKPGNIMLDQNGQPAVVDFGLALKDEEVGRGPRYAGTPAYMSPEQARGEGHRVDGRSDIFSLGVVFYELLTGRRPFQGDSEAELLEQITTFEARPPRQIDDAVPKELERICLKALSKRASERYTTAKDMADDLRHCLDQSTQQDKQARGTSVPLAAPSSSSPAPATPVPTPVTPPASDSRPIKIVPKGLRSFDEHDADFFLELLPGPRDRDGLPDSLRFWKSRIEETDADKTFSVGLIYGPSGCGKSSLVKAGLLPRLSANVIPVFIEATGRETEARLLSGLRKQCPALPPHLGLKESLAALRRGQYLPAGKKLLIILDQFEQWLHGLASGEHALASRERQRPESPASQERLAADGDYETTELVQALRHCDGGRVQGLVMVRDDFWLAVTRFMTALEVELLQGQNMALADLFDPRHAKKVLTALGRAFGALPEAGQSLSKDQEAFLSRAVAGLTQDGKIISVRLALFAEMVKGKPWTPATLREVGGTEGVGVTFLHDTFSSKTANPKHRLHQRAAKAVLQALLPESGSDIRGRLRSHGDLLAASGYAGRPKDFDELIRILDGELRLLTPTDPEGRDEGGRMRDDPETAGRASPISSLIPHPSSLQYYQLTHDYLVRSLRDWLERTLSTPKRLWRWCRRNPQVASLTAAVICAVLLGTVVSIHYAIHSDLERNRADEKAVQADQEKKRADKVASDAEANLYVARMNVAQTDWENANVGRILETLAPYRQPPADKRDPRGWEWYYQDRLCQLELRTLKGHTGPVSSVALSPDGSRLASGSEDQTIKVWDTASGQELRTLKGHTDQVWSVAFSPDGSRLASASGDQTIKVWDTASGQELRTLKGHTGGVLSVAFSPDGSRLASASWDRTIKVWDTASGQELRTLKGHTDQVSSVAFSPDGRRLASASWDRTIKVWNTASGQELRTFKGHTNWVTSVAFSPDGSRLASASWDRTIKVWDTAGGQELRTLKGHTDQVWSVAFSPDGSRLASASWDQTIKVWDTASGRELRTFKGHTGPVTSVAFSPDGRRLASASGDQTIKVWDTAGGQELRTFKGHTGPVTSVAFNPDGSRLASASWDRTIKVWDTASGQELRTLKGHTDQVWSVAFSPDGSRLASASGDQTIKVWDTASGQELRTLKGHSGGVLSVAFSPDGSRLASASGDQTIKVWDTAGGQELRTLKGHTDGVLSVAFSPDGSRLASASGDQTIKVWDTASGQELRTLKGHTGGVLSVAFSPDGSRLASASADQTIKVWDTASGQELRTLKGHTGGVWRVAFSLDGSRLASASGDQTIKVWDTAGGQELRTLKGHTGGVLSVAFSPGGNRLASGSDDQMIHVWDARPWTPELRRQREALGLVEYFCQEFPSKEKVAGRIRADKGITDDVRQEALKLSETYWPRHARLQLAGCMFDKKWDLALRYAEQLLAAFPKDGDLYAARAEIALAQERPGDAKADLARAVKLGGEPAFIHRATLAWAVAKREGVIQDWLILGPLPLKAGQTGAEALDEPRLAEEAKPRPWAGKKEKDLAGGKELEWEARNLSKDFVIDFVEIFKGKKTDRSVAYAVCYLFTDKKLDGLKMLVGSDDQTKIYLNGDAIHEHDVLRALTPDEDTIDNITLEAGRNVLVFKVVNAEGSWGGCIRFVDRTGLPAKGIRVSLTPLEQGFGPSKTFGGLGRTSVKKAAPKK